MPLLSDRVTAPAHLSLPAAVGGLTFRPAMIDDLEAVHAVYVAACAVDAPGWYPSTEDVLFEFSTETVDLAQDSLVGVDADGHVVAAALVRPVPGRDTMVCVVVDGAVHPDYRGRGIGRRVLAWQAARGRQVLAGAEVDLPGLLEVNAEDGSAPARLAARLGFAPVRSWIDMERDLTDPVDLPPLADGFTMRPLAADDVELLRAVKNDVFRDHWGSQPMSADDWSKLLAPPRSRHDLSRVVVDDAGAIVAFSIVDVDPEAFAARGHSYGYVHWVGSVRSVRGRGIAPAVLGSSLDAIRQDGLAAAVLDVDAENPTGALGIYERLGFVRGTTTVTLAQQF